MEYEESIYNLIPKERYEPPKDKRHKSKHPHDLPPTASTFANATSSRPGVGNLNGEYKPQGGNHPTKTAAGTFGKPKGALKPDVTGFRKKGTGILRGNAGLILDPEDVSLASIMQRAGYRTAVVGKWHLGLGPPAGAGPGVDWNQAIKPGPLEIGFDYCFLMPTTGDRVPCVYVENHRVVDLEENDPISVTRTVCPKHMA